MMIPVAATLTVAPPTSKLPLPVRVAPAPSVYELESNSTRAAGRALKTPLLVPVCGLNVPLWTSTVPLLLKAMPLNTVLPVVVVLRNVPTLLNGDPAEQQWK